MLNNSTAKSRYWKQIKGGKNSNPNPLHYVQKKVEINSFSLSFIYLVICFPINEAKTRKLVANNYIIMFSN